MWVPCMSGLSVYVDWRNLWKHHLNSMFKIISYYYWRWFFLSQYWNGTSQLPARSSSNFWRSRWRPLDWTNNWLLICSIMTSGLYKNLWILLHRPCNFVTMILNFKLRQCVTLAKPRASLVKNTNLFIYTINPILNQLPNDFHQYLMYHYLFVFVYIKIKYINNNLNVILIFSPQIPLKSNRSFIRRPTRERPSFNGEFGLGTQMVDPQVLRHKPLSHPQGLGVPFHRVHVSDG